MSYLWTILGTLAVCYVGLAIFSLLFANKMIFPAPPSSYTEDTFPSLIKLPLPEGGEVCALHLPNEEAKYTLLYHHGNAEDLGHIYPHLQELQKRGWAVFAYDYPGYGLSEGKPSEWGSLAAAKCAYSYLRTLLDVPSENIVLYGRSLGGGPAVHLASQEKVAGLILDGTFTSTYRVITKIKLLPWDTFDNIKHTPSIDEPLLSIHGTADLTVPFWHGVRLFEAAAGKKEKLWVEGAGHNDLLDIAGQDYWDAIEAFKQSL